MTIFDIIISRHNCHCHPFHVSIVCDFDHGSPHRRVTMLTQTHTLDPQPPIVAGSRCPSTLWTPEISISGRGGMPHCIQWVHSTNTMWPEANTTCIGINFGIVKSEEINLTEGHYNVLQCITLQSSVLASVQLFGSCCLVSGPGSNSGLFDPIETFVFVPADTFADIC